MATQTVNEKVALAAAPATTDVIPIWDVSASAYKKITVANFLGGYMTGGGTVATGGFTLTVPATGTAALLGAANTFSALQTFSAGISFGDDTLDTYDEGTFDARLMDSSDNTASVFSSNLGKYTRIGNAIIGTGKFQLSSGLTGLVGSDLARITLPFAASNVSNYQAINTIFCQTDGLPDYGQTLLRIVDNSNYAIIYYIETNAVPAQLLVSQLSDSNQTFIYSFIYHVD
jgi:hypothetical protein